MTDNDLAGGAYDGPATHGAPGNQPWSQAQPAQSYGQAQPVQPYGQAQPTGHAQPEVQQVMWQSAPAPYHAMGHGLQVHPKSPALHGLASFLIGGLGSMLAGRVVGGAIIMVSMIFTSVLMLIPFIGLLLIPVFLVLWGISIFHGYRSAQIWNSQHGIIS